MTALELNNELDVPVELADVQCTPSNYHIEYKTGNTNVEYYHNQNGYSIGMIVVHQIMYESVNESQVILN